MTNEATIPQLTDQGSSTTETEWGSSTCEPTWESNRPNTLDRDLHMGLYQHTFLHIPYSRLT
jgi:hypothetical protein